MKKVFIFVLTLILSLSSLVFADNPSESTDNQNHEFLSAKGKVLKIISDSGDNGNNNSELSFRKQIVKIKVLDGTFKDHEFIVENSMSGNLAYDIVLEEGDKVILSIEDKGENDINVYVSDFVRDTYLFVLVIIFIVSLIAIGGFKGIKSVVTLLITGFIVLYVMLPLILKGYDPLLVTIVCTIFITLITFFIIAGVNMKSVSAIVGTTGGVLFAGFLAYIVGSLVRLTGLSSEEAGMLMFIPQEVNFDFRSLLFAGIIIGTLGAVMDVSMSISSAMYELKELNPDTSYKSLVKSGLNIGKDIMGTMSNTLILAYTGSSIPLLLLFMAYNTSLSKILNLDLIATEVVRALVGSIGLVLAIPITALCTGFIIKVRSDK